MPNDTPIALRLSRRRAGAILLAGMLALAAPAALAGDAERLAGQLADLVNASSEGVRCTPRPADLSILCTAEDGGEGAAERLAAYLAHLIQAHADGALEGWTVIVSPAGRGEW